MPPASATQPTALFFFPETAETRKPTDLEEEEEETLSADAKRERNSRGSLRLFRYWIMESNETDLHKKLKKLELEELEKYKFSPDRISAFETLLLDVYGDLRPREAAYQDRENLVHVFDAMAKRTYGSNGGFPTVEAFGSFVMDLFTAKSDLDLSLNFSAEETSSFSREKKISLLRKFAKILYVHQRKGKVSGVLPILRARVPVVKVVDRGTGIECDISAENRDGISRSLIINLICLVDERFRILSFLMKAWAKAHDINSTKDHTLSSLSIILLVAFHLQTRDPPIFPPFSALLRDGPHPISVENIIHGFKQFGRENKESVAELFIALLFKVISPFLPVRKGNQ
uniref:Terminal uridylyltransferase 7 n=1 Tax=Anthurium amnicola TaxID=1678845 RepID=A0A1D1XX20_9ARAE